jgi:hypothetical protein
MSTTADPPAAPRSDAVTQVPTIVPAAPRRGAPDRFMRRLLRLPEGKTSTAAEARSAFQKSLLISTCRCLLMYIIFPFVLPAVGIAHGVGPAIGLMIGALAIVSITYSVRRFWRADHSKRWHYTIFGSVILGFLIYLMVKDLVAVVT